MLQLGYFEIAYNENNHLKITSSGSDVLSAGTSTVGSNPREEFAPAKGRKKKSTIPVRELPLGLPNTESEELFEALRALRKGLQIKKHYRPILYCPTRYCIYSVLPALLQWKHSAISAESVNIKRRNTGRILSS
jgi:hypothetical protein